MKKLLVTLLLIPSLAFGTPTRMTQQQLLNLNNSLITTNGGGEITGSILNSLLGDIIVSSVISSCANGTSNNNTVSSNSQLSALSSTSSTCVTRTGFTVTGDSPTLAYLPSLVPCSINGGHGDGGSQVPSSDGKCWLAQFVGHANASSFGAFSTNIDNATQLQNWLNVASPSLVLELNTGVYNISRAIGFTAACNFCSFHGSGSGATILNYTGSNQTNDIFTIGSTLATSEAVSVKNFHMVSATTMNSGAGIRLNNLNDSYVSGLYTTGLQGVPGNPGGNPHTLWDGITFAGIHEIFVDEIQTYAQHDCVAMYGTSVLGFQNGDLWLTHHLEFGCTNGIHIGGNLGGIFTGIGESLDNTYANVLEDDALDPSHRTNSIIRFDGLFHNDCALNTLYGYYINESSSGGSNGSAWTAISGSVGSCLTADIDLVQDTGGNLAVDSPFVSGTYASFQGTVVGNQLTVVSGLTGTLYIGSSVYYNGANYGTIISGSGSTWTLSGSPGNVTNVSMNTGNIGVYIQDTTTTVNVASGTSFLTDLIGIDASSATANIVSQAVNRSNIIDAGFFTGLSSFTTPTAVGGTSFAATTTVTTSQMNQHMRHVEVTISVTVTGTGVTTVTVPLPFTPTSSNQIGCSLSTSLTTAFAYYTSGTPSLVISKYDGTYPGATGIITCGGDILQ